MTDERDDPVRYQHGPGTAGWFRVHRWLVLWMHAIADDAPQVDTALQRLLARRGRR